MTEGRGEARAGGVLGADARYSTFLSLSGDGIARFEIDPPMRVAASEAEQVEHILRSSRVAECNDQFARFYGRATQDMAGAAMGEFVPSDDPARLRGIQEFIRACYRLESLEEEHAQTGAPPRWVSGSALGAPKDGLLREFWLCLRDISSRKRSELDRERRGRVLEALAFSSARLLQPGSWKDQAEEVLARLGEAAQAGRAWIAQQRDDADGASHILYRFAWGAPGQEMQPDRIVSGLSVAKTGLGRL
ncbi:MAG TPA: PAS domain-containing protein, partial [Vicinamibacteria bacterium]